MKIITAMAATLMLAQAGTALAAGPPGSLAAAGIACNSPTDWRTGPAGRVEVCLDGSYATCVRDARDRLGYGQAGVERCNQLRSQGRIK